MSATGGEARRAGEWWAEPALREAEAREARRAREWWAEPTLREAEVGEDRAGLGVQGAMHPIGGELAAGGASSAEGVEGGGVHCGDDLSEGEVGGEKADGMTKDVGDGGRCGLAGCHGDGIGRR